MIALSVISNEQRQIVIFGDEPFRTEVIHDLNTTTAVYEGVRAEEGTPQYHPALSYDASEAENYSLVSFKQAEITELRGRGQTVQEITEALMQRGIGELGAKSIALSIQQQGNDESYWNPDCQRFVYNYRGTI